MRSSPSSCPRSLFPSYFSVAHPTRFYSKLTPILTTSFDFTVLFKVIRENLTMNNFHQAINNMIKPAWSHIVDYWDDVILEKLEIVKLFPQELTIFLPSTSWQNLAARRTTVTMTNQTTIILCIQKSPHEFLIIYFHPWSSQSWQRLMVRRDIALSRYPSLSVPSVVLVRLHRKSFAMTLSGKRRGSWSVKLSETFAGRLCLATKNKNRMSAVVIESGTSMACRWKNVVIDALDYRAVVLMTSVISFNEVDPHCHAQC